jgi:hypothetical protein
MFVKIASNVLIILAVILITLYITDLIQPSMAFIDNRYSNALVLVFSVLAIADSICVLLIYGRE